MYTHTCGCKRAIETWMSVTSEERFGYFCTCERDADMRAILPYVSHRRLPVDTEAPVALL